MNRHFKRNFDELVELPSSVFGRVDHVVTSGPPSNIVLIAVDAIEVKWLNDQAKQDERFVIDNPMVAAAAWERQGYSTQNAASIFESAPLFRIEVELEAGTNPFGLPFLPEYDHEVPNKGAQALEDAWFRFEVSKTARIGFIPALIYPGLFATPIPAFVQGTMPTPVHANALAGIFSLKHFPMISGSSLRECFGSTTGDMLAVYDVGQGNANALLNSDQSSVPALPTLYFDLGAGVYRNKHT
ncbi:hypothetical protein, partial [Aurantimicrobium sp.]|uniref:hypothetical protein n=1 Tax=Aurantimicrobium sp. TaxID=1930784 RepID=UPI002FC61732